VDNADLDAFIARVQDSLGPNPTKEETVEATTAAMLALTEEERQSVSEDQLRRRLAVYRSVELGT
jgi:hypothetical protein